MAKLHIFIDGSWFYKICETGVLARHLATPEKFELDFNKLKDLILKHVSKHSSNCNAIGDCFNVTSIFNLPPDFDEWVGRDINGKILNEDSIKYTRTAVHKREEFAKRAIDAGFDANAVLRVNFKEWMIEKLIERRYQEKQVDTSVVALLVKYAICYPNDYFALVAGDADMLPAINIACPEFTNNVCLVTTHPDELDTTHRQTNFSYTQYAFKIDNLYLQDYVKDIMKGNHVYQCIDCHKLFYTERPKPSNRQARCEKCRSSALQKVLKI